MWSRRQFVSALGGAGAGLALGGWLSACRSGQGIVGLGQADLAPFDISGELLEAHGIISQQLRNVAAWSRHRHTHELVFDSSERTHDTRARHQVVLSGLRGDEEFSVALCNPAPGDLRVAALGLTGKDSQRDDNRKRITAPTRKAKSPWNGGVDAGPIQDLLTASQEHGGSRIVYRSAYLTRQSDEVQLITDSGTHRQSALRNRVGLLMSAWTGTTLASAGSEIANSGTKQPVLKQARLAELATRALSNLYARSAPQGELEVLLAPDAAALVLQTLATEACDPVALVLPKTPVLKIIDDPTQSAAFGSLKRDDVGTESLPQLLVGDGGPMLLGAGRKRRDEQAKLHTRPTHVMLEGGSTDWQSIVGTMTDGVLMEDALYCGLGADRHTLTLVCRRGREVRKGRFTGRVFGRLMMRASLTDFLAQSKAVGSVADSFAFSDHGIASSISSPHWLSHGRIEAG